VRPTEETNFCRVFELPLEYPEGFCFDGSKPVVMQMVDWFNPWPSYYDTDEPETWEEVVVLLRLWLEEKCYVRPGRTYILITDFGESFVFGGLK